MAKRQFVQFKPKLGDKDTEQTAVPRGMDAVEHKRARVSPSAPDTSSSTQQLGARRTGGLLSGWKPEQTQDSRNPNSEPTLLLPATPSRREPSSEPGLDGRNFPGFAANQISPHESGMGRSPFAVPYQNVSATPPTPQLPMATPAQPFVGPGNRPAFPSQPSGGPAVPASPMLPQTPTPLYTGPLAPSGASAQPYGQGMQPPMVPAQPYGQGMRPPVSQQLNNGAMWQPAAAPGQYRNNQPPMQNGTQKRRRKRRVPIWAQVAVAALTCMLILLGSGLWYYQTNFSTAVGHITGQGFTKFGTGTGANTSTTNSPDNSNGTNSTDILSGKRVNVLLLGSDNDSKFQGTVLAQTDIIITIDPQTNYVGMLSIPRDLQVTIPGLNIRDKLDTAFSYGFQSKRTNNPYADAAGLSIATIEENFGIPIDHYAWVGLTGFIKVIDTVGGVDVSALHPMVDDDYPDDTTGSKNDYGYRRVYIAPGPQHMDGPQALMYVRTRHSDLVGDFGRSARQQQILSVLKTKMQGSNTVSELPQLLNDLDGYVKTDMQLPDLVKMVNYAHNVDLNKVDRKVMSQPYSVPIPRSSNFAPVCSLVIPLEIQMFGLSADQARCLPQMANTGGTGNSALASSSAPSSLQAMSVSLPPPPASNALQSLQQIAEVGTLNLSQGKQDVLGFNSIFTVVFMVACESFDVVKV